MELIINETSDGGLTITSGEQTITLSTDQCDQISTELVVWRWRKYGDSHDPIAAARIRNEAHKSTGKMSIAEYESTLPPEKRAVRVEYIEN